MAKGIKIKTDVLYPTRPFEDFYKSVDYVYELMSEDEWEVYKNFYSFSKEELEIPCHETIHDLRKFSPAKQNEEVEKCANSFAYFCHRYVKILHPVHGTIPFILYNYQHKVIGDFTSNKFNIIRKFRQGGLTTVAVLWGLWRCLFTPDQQVYVLSITDREGKKAGEIAQHALDNMPGWLYEEHNSILTKHEKVFKSPQSKICFYTPKAARGKAASLIIIDEAAFIPNMHHEWKAMYPVVATGGDVQIVSTVNGLGNWYEEMYHEAEAGDNFFNIIDLGYTDHPQYASPEWAKHMRANIGEKAWKQEIEGSFLGSGETYFSANIIGELDKHTRDIGYIRAAFPKWINLNNETRAKFNWGEGALWFWKEPIDDHEYIIGVDCAEGVGASGDNNSFQVIDSASVEQVAEFYSNTVPPNVFSKISTK